MELQTIIQKINISAELKNIAIKIFENKRISIDECVVLYKNADLSLVGMLANQIRENKNGNNTYFNKNLHIEPTNICIHNCKFCSYSKKIGGDGWESTVDEMLDTINKADDAITEVHIVGGVHPHRDIHYYGNLIMQIKLLRPKLHVKAFTAVEIDFMIKKAGLSLNEGVLLLKEYGLDSIPGGGAEIFDEELRAEICPSKTSSEQWLAIHEALHQVGIPSNATILYGHIETYRHRAEHMERLRLLQDRTNGFNAFIPLKFKHKNNTMSEIKEVSVIEDLKNYAISRIFLDNFPHIKSYWPMVGKQLAQLSLSFGVDDFDGTINDSTKIYSLAGSEEQNPSMTTEEMEELITAVGRIAVERDSVYNHVKSN
ncbi:MAG: CofH family radical SAM protein [Bacteroidetes bacterium]|nr:CofH family radical SAM protein [Bacteroidota bacterium]